MAKSMRTAFIRVHCSNNTSDGVVVYTMEDIEKMVASIASSYIATEYAFILHNKDIDPDGKLKAPHFHIVFRFKNPVPFEVIKKVFPYGEIKPAGSINATVQYLCHKNNPEKTAYEYNEIKSNMDESVLEKLFTEISIADRKGDDVLKQIVARISSGEIKEYNRFDYIDEFSLVKYDRQIKIAFKNRSERIMKDANRDIKVFFLTGPSGCGKTTYAKMMAAGMGDGSFYVSGSKNDSLQDYKGENTLILDELRDDAFDLDDLLKVLDNHTASAIKSRFFNKCFLGEAIIITTSKKIEEWYSYTKEDRGQFYRRVKAYCMMSRDKVEIYEPVMCSPVFPSKDSFRFEKRYEFQNPVAVKMAAEEAAKRADANAVLDVFAGALASMKLPEEENERLKQQILEARKSEADRIALEEEKPF